MNISRVDMKNEIGDKRIYLALFSAIAAIALAIRLVAATRLPVNAYESTILLRLLDNPQYSTQPVSILEMIFIRSGFFFFGPSAFVARIASVLAGTALVLVPFYLREKIGQRLAIVIALIVTFEPFLLANAVQVGSNIFAVLAVLTLLSSVWKRDYKFSLAATFILILSGRGLFFAIFFLVVTYYIDQRLAWSIFPEIPSVKEAIHQFGNRAHTFMLPFFAVFSLLLIIMQIDLSDILAPTLTLFQPADLMYMQKLSNFALPILFLSYSPTLLFFFGAFTFPKNADLKKIQLGLVTLSLLLFTLLLFSLSLRTHCYILVLFFF